MQAEVKFDGSFAELVMQLEAGESLQAEPGALVAQQGVRMETGFSGGLLGGLRRSLGGESFFMNTFTGEAGGGWVRLAAGTPGSILDWRLSQAEELFIQGSSFLACSPEVKVDSKFQGWRGLFSGEGLFFLRMTVEEGASRGSVYCNAYGGIEELRVNPGEELVVDTGHLVGFDTGVEYGIGRVGGLRSMVAGGEGLVLKFRGSGKVWIQTRNLKSLAEVLLPFLPQSGKGK